MTWKEHYKKIIAVALPVSIGQLGHILVVLADSIMIGQLGAAPLAAASFANSIFLMVFIFGYGISFGVTPLVAAADGKNDTAESGKLLKNSFLLALMAGTTLFLIVELVRPLLPFMGQEAIVVQLGSPYFALLGLSMVPLMLFMFCKQFAEGLSLTKYAMIVSIVGNLLNVFFNYLLIFGNWGFPEMELKGAGWATFSARLLMAIAMVVYIFFHKDFHKYLVVKVKFSMIEIRKILTIGIPSGIQFIFEVGAFVVGAIMIGWIGATELAAHQIAISLVASTYMVATGIAAAATVRVGNAFGRNDLKSARKAGFSSFHLSLIFMGCGAIVFILGNATFPTWYIDNPEVIDIASSLFIIAAFFQLSDGLQVVGLGALRGLTDVKIPTIVTFVAYWVLGLSSSYLLAFTFNLGVQGVWYGFIIGLSSAALMHVLRFNYLTKQ
jgi:MATE family multidrug resistance protein